MYENLIDPQIQILERCQVAWDNMMPNLPDDLSPYGVLGLTKTDIEKSFSMVIDRLGSIKAQAVEERNPFLVQILGQSFPSWTTPLESWIPSAASYISNINSHLSAMWTTLNTYSYEPNKEELNKLFSENRNLESEAKSLLKITANLTRKKEELTEALAQSKKITKEYSDLLAEVQKSKVVIETDALVAVAHREGIVSDKAETDAQLKVLKAATAKLPEFEQKCDAITKQCDEILVEAKSRLDAASRAGMATSFSDRASEYVWPRRFWLISFVLSLAGVFLVAYCFIVPELVELEGSDRFFHFITDVPLTLPFIWLAWFSALRFSQLGRLREDYAFKVATALSLDGYRKQANDVSPDLQEKLLDLAITNFGENPLRLMTKDSAKDAHPLAGALDEKTLNEIVKSAFQALSDKISK